MEKSKILTADFLDILFEGRNKEYGAYELRRTYASRLRVSVAVMGGLVLVLTAGFLFAGNGEQVVSNGFIIHDTIDLAKIEPTEPIEVPPPPKPEPPPEVMERKSTNIEIVPDNLVHPEDMPPPVEELENARISLVNRDAEPTTDIVAPPAIETAVGNGIVAELKKPNPDSLFLSVQIESKYPGGNPAWQRFLIKNLSDNYPQEAIDQEISGKVEVGFVVDREGNVSNVQALSGPKELHGIAIKTIRKSGKWEPAIQNGAQVKSYKRQAIVFTLQNQ